MVFGFPIKETLNLLKLKLNHGTGVQWSGFKGAAHPKTNCRPFSVETTTCWRRLRRRLLILELQRGTKSLLNLKPKCTTLKSTAWQVKSRTSRLERISVSMSHVQRVRASRPFKVTAVVPPFAGGNPARASLVPAAQVATLPDQQSESKESFCSVSLRRVCVSASTCANCACALVRPQRLARKNPAHFHASAPPAAMSHTSPLEREIQYVTRGDAIEGPQS